MKFKKNGCLSHSVLNLTYIHLCRKYWRRERRTSHSDKEDLEKNESEVIGPSSSSSW